MRRKVDVGGGRPQSPTLPRSMSTFEGRKRGDEMRGDERRSDGSLEVTHRSTRTSLLSPAAEQSAALAAPLARRRRHRACGEAASRPPSRPSRQPSDQQRRGTCSRPCRLWERASRCPAAGKEAACCSPVLSGFAARDTQIPKHENS